MEGFFVNYISLNAKMPLRFHLSSAGTHFFLEPNPKD
jgi:hypothetical protein